MNIKGVNKNIILIAIFTICIFLNHINTVSADIEYIPYNMDDWFKNWRNTEFDDTPLDICFIVDDSGSTLRTDKNRTRDTVVKQFMKNMNSDDRFAVTQDNGTSDYVLLHSLTSDKQSIENSIRDRIVGVINKPAYSMDACIGELSDNTRSKAIVHLGDGGFGYTYEEDDDAVHGKEIDEGLISRIKNNNIRMYGIGFSNSEAEYQSIEEFGSLKDLSELLGGKYYRLKIGEEAVPILDCKDKDYAESHKSECYTCKNSDYASSHPDECYTCDNSDYAESHKDECMTCSNEKYAKKHTSECYTCDNEEYKKTHEDICTKVSCNGSEMRLKDAKRLSKIIDAIKKLIDMSKIIVPIILILMGSIDMIKAMLANNEESKKIYMLFVRRCIYAVCVFLLGTIINFIFNLVGIDYKDCEVIETVSSSFQR